jgi:exo-1,4-beta-D-glucosaminidase
VTLTSRTEERGGDELVRVTVGNSTPRLAFFVHLKVRKGKDGEDIRPIYWDDNYFSLMPGESREIVGAYPRKLMGSAKANVEVDGWNLRE